MSKSHRGSGIRELVKQGRGTCPICKRTGIKLMYEHEVKEQKIKVCKQCHATIKHGKAETALAAL
ncbi:MAG: hypothetical protein K9L66_02185 [Spirochaetaceae bacterium]|nr:hypothetical protein [Spirochaetaceae bacterium]MCF7948807.1 hypothetical protein [Spirochaetia bacterium]MCF7950462.1 hypothetical protein [Spirochaetaceae bacterium]